MRLDMVISALILLALTSVLLVNTRAPSTPSAHMEVDRETLHTSVASDDMPIPKLQKAASPKEKGFKGSGEMVDQPRHSPRPRKELRTTSPLPQPNASGIIIGECDLERLPSTIKYPYSAIVRILNTKAPCSGWMYGPDIVATAGHCVHGGGKDGNWYDRTKMSVVPGYPSEYYRECGVERLYSVKGWTEWEKEEYDYGAIKLDCTVGNKTGWFGYFWQENTLDSLPIEVAGYPTGKCGNDEMTGGQWKCTGSVGCSDADQIFYLNDTTPQMSGAPLFFFPDPAQDLLYDAIAIHTNAPHGGACKHSCYNHGTRITQSVFENMRAWRAAP